MGKHLACMLHEQPQQIVLLGRELHLLVADLDDAAHQIDAELIHVIDRPLPVHLQLVSQRGAHAGEKLVHSERLRHVVVGAKIQGRDLASLIAATGEHHDRQALLAVTYPAQELQSVNIGEAKIEDDEIWFLGQQLERRLAIGRVQHIIALGREPHPQELADRRLVVDHQDFDPSGTHSVVSTNSPCAGTGSLIVKTAPVRSARLAAPIVPSIASTNPREIASPRPVPARTWSPFCTR